MSSSISSFRICKVPFSSTKGNGGSISSLPRSVKLPSYPRQVVGITKASDANRDSLDHLQRASQQPKKRAPQPQAGTPVVLWDRYPAARTVQQMMDTMERLMEDPFAYGSSTWQPAPAAETNGFNRRGRAPWAIQEGETSYKIRLDMPGMTRKDVRVWVEQNMLVVKAEKVPKKSQDGQAEIAADPNEEEDEWPVESYGKYNSRIQLPEGVDVEKVKAEVKDGVLYIAIPKARATSKKIDISVQ